jgi:hypothetical protein
VQEDEVISLLIAPQFDTFEMGDSKPYAVGFCKVTWDCNLIEEEIQDASTLAAHNRSYLTARQSLFIDFSSSCPLPLGRLFALFGD